MMTDVAVVVIAEPRLVAPLHRCLALPDRFQRGLRAVVHRRVDTSGAVRTRLTLRCSEAVPAAHVVDVI